MATFKYTGEDAREFPTLAITVNSGDTFDASDDFISANVIPVSKKAPTIAPTVGE